MFLHHLNGIGRDVDHAPTLFGPNGQVNIRAVEVPLGAAASLPATFPILMLDRSLDNSPRVGHAFEQGTAACPKRGHAQKGK
jgi:hypothetical protein